MARPSSGPDGFFGGTNKSPLQLIRNATRLIEEEGSFAAFVRDVGAGGVFFAIVSQLIQAIQGAGSLTLAPLRALGYGVVLLIEASFTGIADVFGAGTGATVRSFSSGLGNLLGPLAQPAAVGVGVLSFGVVVYAFRRSSISPLTFILSLRG